MIIRDPIGNGKTHLDDNLGFEARIQLVNELTDKWEKRCKLMPEIWEQGSVKSYFDLLATYVLSADKGVQKNDFIR